MRTLLIVVACLWACGESDDGPRATLEQLIQSLGLGQPGPGANRLGQPGGSPNRLGQAGARTNRLGNPGADPNGIVAGQGRPGAQPNPDDPTPDPTPGPNNPEFETCIQACQALVRCEFLSGAQCSDSCAENLDEATPSELNSLRCFASTTNCDQIESCL